MKTKRLFISLVPFSLGLVSLVGCVLGNNIKFEEKVVKIYNFLDTTKTYETKLYFSNSVKGIPYIDLNDAPEFLNLIHNFGNTHGLKFKADNNQSIFKITHGNKPSLNFNFDTNVIECSDLGAFKSNNYHKNAFDVRSYDDRVYDDAGEIVEGKHHLNAFSSNECYDYKGDDYYVDLDNYHIKLYRQNNKYYVPFTTFYNIAGSNFITCVFNGENLFALNESGLGNLSDTFYASPTKGENRSKELVEYNYYEFCRDLDYVYGLKNEHGISSFDQFMSKNGLKDLFLSGSKYDEDKAYLMLQFTYLAESHTTFMFQNAYENGLDLSEISKIMQDIKINPEYNQRIEKRNARKLIRQTYKNLNDSGAVINKTITNGDTLVITFDNFLGLGIGPTGFDYYNPISNLLMLFMGDTISLINSVYNTIKTDIAQSTPTIKHIVLDLSGNTGGSIDAGIFTLGWLDSAVVQLQNPITKSYGALRYGSDINYDEQITSADKLLFSNPTEKANYIAAGNKVYEGDVYCLISDTTFSCGNYVAAMLKQSGLVKLIGSKSGGGACVVNPSSTPDGSGFSKSGCNKLCTVKNGVFYSIDDGVEPDYYLDDPNILYGGSAESIEKGASDRANIVEYIHNLK